MRNSILLCIAVILTSCDFMDRQPMDFVAPEQYYRTGEQMEAALNGVYSTLAEGALYGNNMLGRMGLSADIGYESYSPDEGMVGYYQVYATDVKVANYWKELYEGIGRANRLLENISRPQMNEKRMNEIKGEALFLRAYFYFMLTVRFGDVPLVLNVPESGYLADVQVPQTPSREVYRKIIEDMEEASGLVKDATEVTGGGRVTKSAVWGILARVCLNMAGYPLYEPGMYAKAKVYASKVMDLDFHSLNPSYSEVFVNMIQDRYDIKESIFEVEFYGNNVGTYSATAGMVGRNNGIGFSNTAIDTIGISIGTIRATPYFIQLFGEGDLRRDWTISPYTYDSTTGAKVQQPTNYWIRYSGKFRREYELTMEKSALYTPANFPILRYSDVLLMYAEGVAADPDNSDAAELSKAYECLNMVRRRGYGKDTGKQDSSVDIAEDGKTILLEVIKDERARELGHELLRKDDVVRWGEFESRMKYIAASVPGAYVSSYYVAARTAYNSASSRDVLWPIPSYELGINRKLVQNVGW